MDAEIAACVIILSQKRRRIWAKKWLQSRKKKSCLTLVKELTNEPADFKNFLRMDINSFNFLLNAIRSKITKNSTKLREAISPIDRLAVTLRYLATGNSFSDLQFSSRISKCSLSNIIFDTCSAIIETLRSDYLKVPCSSVDEWQNVSREFEQKWNFPHCLGAIDGKHIMIYPPSDTGSYYFNYKGFHSIVLLAVVNASYEFIYVDIGTNGRVSDGGVFKKSSFAKAIEDNTLNFPIADKIDNYSPELPYVFVGDDAFSLSEKIMKPFPFRDLALPKRIYNYRLSRARRVVENAFGILSTRFRVLQSKIYLHPSKVEKIVMTCCILHNYLRRNSRNYYTPPGSVDQENLDNGVVNPGMWRNTGSPLAALQSTNTKNSSNSAKSCRDLFCDYFNTSGSVEWQVRAVSGI